MDRLKLNAIEVECVLGDLPEERRHAQRILVDVALELDLSDAGLTDDLEDTVDYALLVGAIRETLEEARCRLLERAAALVADVCLAERGVSRAVVTVRKTGSVPGLGSAEVTLERPL